MVPFDERSPFVTSGMRIGTPAVTTRGLKEDDMTKIVELIDRVIENHEDESSLKEIKHEVNEWMITFHYLKPNAARSDSRSKRDVFFRPSRRTKMAHY